MASGELEARIGRLEDIEEIKKLKGRFCFLLDTGGKWEELVNMFTEDGVGDAGPFGRYEGKAELTKFYRDTVPGSFSFMKHMLHNPVVKVNGDKATSEYYFDMAGTHKAPKRAIWISGKYDDEYVKVDGVWKFKIQRGTIFYYSPQDSDWVKMPMYE